MPSPSAAAARFRQPVREHYGKPFTPLSWFRCVDLCKAIGSSATSQHAKGQAADFEVPGVANIDLARWIDANLKYDQLILEFWDPNDPSAGWIHCSYVSPEKNRQKPMAYNGKKYTPGLPT